MPLPTDDHSTPGVLTDKTAQSLDKANEAKAMLEKASTGQEAAAGQTSNPPPSAEKQNRGENDPDGILERARAFRLKFTEEFDKLSQEEKDQRSLALGIPHSSATYILHF
jgi:hypothetical protein